jgi:hypothetical protein
MTALPVQAQNNGIFIAKILLKLCLVIKYYCTSSYSKFTFTSFYLTLSCPSYLTLSLSRLMLLYYLPQHCHYRQVHCIRLPYLHNTTVVWGYYAYPARLSPGSHVDHLNLWSFVSDTPHIVLMPAPPRLQLSLAGARSRRGMYCHEHVFL